MLLKKVVLVGILLLFLVNLASAQYYYDQSYNFGLFSFNGLDDVLNIYELNSGLIDFFIFLTIFLGLSQAVFGEGHFKKQSKTISIGLSLALSFGLVMWERNSGINLLTLGPLAFLIILLLIFYVIFSILKKMGNEWWVAGAWAYVVIYLILITLGSQVFNWTPVSNNLFPLMNLFFYICIVAGLGGLIWASPPRRTPPAGSP